MIYKREDLIRPIGGPFWFGCDLCKRANTTPDSITHREDCVLADLSVEQVRVEAEPRCCGKCGTQMETAADLICIACANSI